MKNIHRINDFSLLKIIVTQNTANFWKVKNEINLTNAQFFALNELNNVVWESGIYKHKLNKILSVVRLNYLYRTYGTFKYSYFVCITPIPYL